MTPADEQRVREIVREEGAKTLDLVSSYGKTKLYRGVILTGDELGPHSGAKNPQGRTGHAD